tara:strand:+ start:434 stop:1720 length:1287 start_codon:yes stop_codon:yes gene_type:complete
MVGTWQRLAHVALSSAGDTIDSGTFTAKKNLRVIAYTKGANTELQFRFNSDSGSNYASRRSGDGGSDSTFTSQTQSKVNATGGASTTETYMTADITNISDKEKLVTSDQVASEATGAGTAPRRSEGVTKWANTSAQITSIQIINNASGDFAAGSYITVLGASGDIVTDEKTTLTNVPLNTRYEETDTRKIYRGVEKLTVSDDLSTDKGWTSNSSDFTYNATNDSIDLATLRRNTTSQEIYIDLQDSDYLGSGNNLSDSSFVFRFGKIRWNTVPAGGGVTANIMLSKGLQDSGTNQYTVNLQQILNSSERITRARANSNTNNEGNSTHVQSFSSTYTPNTSNIYRWEIVRDGNDFAFKVYAESDSSYSTPLETKTVTATGITDLRYILITNDSEQTNSTTADMEILGDIDIYNGTTTTTGVAWKERGSA